MDQIQRENFLIELLDSIKTDILARAAAMPDNWDGHELRRYVSDQTRHLAGGHLQEGNARATGNTKRLKAYRNDVITRNL